ncbi:hypothetical protein BV898_14192 [Hypsibius exemplaris]|uniref:Uncharacterized protein n=1 Tax=Hypsibius exemplaris TaxID=2072580 RepID=A0A1W0W8L1_HYPEX|nr:hypothetical protein BV898_14192 [Hypsibius exemplaris]
MPINSGCLGVAATAEQKKNKTDTRQTSDRFQVHALSAFVSSTPSEINERIIFFSVTRECQRRYRMQAQHGSSQFDAGGKILAKMYPYRTKESINNQEVTT